MLYGTFPEWLSFSSAALVHPSTPLFSITCKLLNYALPFNVYVFPVRWHSRNRITRLQTFL
jgi:hypothetical protein